MTDCKKRKTLIKFKADGTKEEFFQCAERTAPMHTLTILDSDCEACPVRETVNKREIDHAARMTSNLRGFVRQEQDNGSPGFPDCDSRIIATVRACCGDTVNVWLCDHRASSRYQSEVDPNICNRCPFKKL